MNMQLRPATMDDLELLSYWDTKPHVIACDPNGSWDWEEELEDVPHNWKYIAELDDRPIGVIQIIDPAKEETHYWGDVEEGLRAIDIWIGEEDDLSKGYGTRMMHLAFEKCFEEDQAIAILIDPLASNTEAHRFYERLGFQFVEERNFEGVNCFVYRLDRSVYIKT